MERAFLIFGIGILLGGAGGAYVMNLIHGKAPAEHALSEAECPKCEECPPPVSCPDPFGAVDVLEDEELEGLDLADDAPPVPGLPASAIQLATEGLKNELRVCLETEIGLSGSALLDLIVTASAAVGRIATATVAQKDGDLLRIEECLLEATRRVRFDWPSADGEAKLRYPIQVGHH